VSIDAHDTLSTEWLELCVHNFHHSVSHSNGIGCMCSWKSNSTDMQYGKDYGFAITSWQGDISIFSRYKAFYCLSCLGFNPECPYTEMYSVELKISMISIAFQTVFSLPCVSTKESNTYQSCIWDYFIDFSTEMMNQLIDNLIKTMTFG